MAGTKEIYSENPIHFSNKRVKSLDEARKILIEAFDEYENAYPEWREELNELKTLFNEVYLKKKASYFLEDRLSYLNDYLNNAFRFALKDHFIDNISSSSPDVRLFYLKRSNKRFTLNDQSL